MGQFRGALGAPDQKGEQVGGRKAKEEEEQEEQRQQQSGSERTRKGNRCAPVGVGFWLAFGLGEKAEASKCERHRSRRGSKGSTGSASRS